MLNVLAALPNIGGALCSTPQLGWRSLLDCRAVTLPRRESRWNLLGCPKLPKPISAASGPKFAILWVRVEDILLPNKFFSRLSIYALVAKIQPDKVVRWCPDGAFGVVFATCISSEQRAAHFRLHSKFAIRPHHVQKHGRHPLCDRWD